VNISPRTKTLLDRVPNHPLAPMVKNSIIACRRSRSSDVQAGVAGTMHKKPAAVAAVHWPESTDGQRIGLR
jgi:hypothetical protein